MLLLTYSCHIDLSRTRYIPPDEGIDLLNVAFENPRALAASKRSGPNSTMNAQDDQVYMVPDRVTGIEQWRELRKLCPSRRWNFVRACPSEQECPLLTLT
jgi:hypothetical protein